MGKGRRGPLRSVHVITKHSGAAGFSQLPQRNALNLPDSLSGHPKLPAHLFQSAASPIHYPKPQLPHPAFPFAQGVKYLVHLLFQELLRGDTVEAQEQYIAL